MHPCLQALSDRVESSQAQEIHRCGAQGCHHSSAVAAVAVVVLVELGVMDPVPALDAPTLSCQSQQGFWGGAQVVMNRCVALNGLPSRIPVAITSAIQLVPCQLTLICSGASFALKDQRMSRPWPIS